jgi:ParB/RepB/Spo0J family partition protein
VSKTKEKPSPVVNATNGNGANRQADQPALGRYELVPIGQIQVTPGFNNRRELGDLSELADSIKSIGLLQPLTVWRQELLAAKTDPSLEGKGWSFIIAGHRRLEACRLAGVELIPCLVQDLDERGRMEALLVENLHRKDIDPLEEAEGYQRLVGLGLNQRDVAAKVGRSQAHISKRLALLELPGIAREAVLSGRISFEDAAQLGTLAEEPGFEAVAEKVLGTHRDIADSRWLTQRIKADLGEALAASRRAATKKRLEDEGKKVLGEAGQSWQAGPGYPAATLDQVIRVAGKTFDAGKHGSLKCAGWFITYEGEAVEACSDYTKHESKASNSRRGIYDDPERERQRVERERQIEAMEKHRSRRHAFIKLLLDGNLGADARDHVVRQAICLYEPEWDLAGDWLGIKLSDEDQQARYEFAPHYFVLRWIQEAPSRRQLQASLALVLEEGEHIIRHDTPAGIGADMAPLARQHFEFLSFAGYKLAPEEQAWLAGEEAPGTALAPDLAEAAADAGVDVNDHAAAAGFVADAGEVDLEALIASVKRKLERVVVERGNLEKAVSIKKERGPHADARRKELEAVKQSEWALEAELSELDARRPGAPSPSADMVAKTVVPRGETASQRMERERRARIDAAKATMSPDAILAREG